MRRFKAKDGSIDWWAVFVYVAVLVSIAYVVNDSAGIVRTPAERRVERVVVDRIERGSVQSANGASIVVRGPRGATGKTGRAGRDGDAGPRGRRGASGRSGGRGPKGTPGKTGKQGAQGTSGPQGAPGPAGVAGLPGVSQPPSFEQVRSVLCAVVPVVCRPGGS